MTLVIAYNKDRPSLCARFTSRCCFSHSLSLWQVSVRGCVHLSEVSLQSVHTVLLTSLHGTMACVATPVYVVTTTTHSRRRRALTSPPHYRLYTVHRLREPFSVPHGSTCCRRTRYCIKLRVPTARTGWVFDARKQVQDPTLRGTTQLRTISPISIRVSFFH